MEVDGQRRGNAMAVYELDAFLRLSAVLNYQLSTEVFGPGNILALLLEENRLPRRQQDLLISVLQYLTRAYGQKRRRLGPMAILHPIRATALLTAGGGKASFLDVLTVLLHDKLEDICPDDFPQDVWLSLEEQFKGLLKQIDPSDEWFLMERLELLRRQEEGQTYCQYIGRMVNQPKQTPDLVRVKLADRLDNTLDMRVDIHDPLEGVDFFSHIFQLLFVGSYTGYKPTLGHPPRSPISGAQRLYELFKNTVLLSLIRQRPDTSADAAASRLFHALALASMKEAQRTIMHIFGYHISDVKQQKPILEEAMSYCLQGGSDAITAPTSGCKLDGLFIGCFDHHDSAVRKEKMELLYLDKPLMVQASVAFIVIFLSFLGDETFYVRGITPDGIRPAEAG
jgi:hypothetical protein